MTHVAIVGGGPAGLSAALFAAKNGLEATVFDTDDTWMHRAHLYNYLGIESEDGTAFVADAREQVEAFGAERRQGEAVTDIERARDGFLLETDDGEYEADYVVVATGTDRDLLEGLGCDTTAEGTIAVDIDMETSVDGVYAVGAVARAQKWQAVISAGDGAAAALDVLSKEKGERFHDFDTPDAAE
ncbi:NAD(P)/FAD-dependent oxidoreductase [Salinilacihabitans rarus]|uniref:NAD(P)/FAD-dependent oxidoreductase n=1 Tax=Salinilacihabitans rarus TaxID=2961596 RepID=UPI0020C903B5|nr:FAD-dependent oxidoreductase [Salinilacihabitans rarus]